jgi:hypothetical protein
LWLVRSGSGSNEPFQAMAGVQAGGYVYQIGSLTLVASASRRWEKSDGRHAISPTPLYGVPDLPPHFLPRAEPLAMLKSAVLSAEPQRVGIGGALSRAGLHGMGGIGKTVLGVALARDAEVVGERRAGSSRIASYATIRWRWKREPTEEYIAYSLSSSAGPHVVSTCRKAYRSVSEPEPYAIGPPKSS